MRLLAFLARLGLSAVFGLAAGVKLAGPQEFAFAVKGFDLLPDHLAILATFVVPWLEAFAAVLLLLGLWTRPAALLLSGLLLVFIAAIASVLWRGMSVECGCFGKLSPLCSGPLGWCNIVQNAVLLALSVLVLVAGPGFLAVDRARKR